MPEPEIVTENTKGDASYLQINQSIDQWSMSYTNKPIRLLETNFWSFENH